MLSIAAQEPKYVKLAGARMTMAGQSECVDEFMFGLRKTPP